MNGFDELSVAERTSIQSGPAPSQRTGQHLSGLSALEANFPFEEVSEIAEVESWRKEVYRPIYHLHKWWAQRLGSVFRALLIGAAADENANVMELFHSSARFEGLTVFDPFMGSGTTIGEALKLGFNAVGRDINPVACFSAKTAFDALDRDALLAAFNQLEEGVGKEIRALYRGIDSAGNECDVLYYFWVKNIDCLFCSSPIDLFSSYIFARHAYAKKYPAAKAICPKCGAVVPTKVDSDAATCSGCDHRFNPQIGPAKLQTATCTSCLKEFPILKSVRQHTDPPRHRMYAKLVLNSRGEKEYLPATDHDLATYKRAIDRLGREDNPFPTASIDAGHNTNQALNYGYRRWHQMFNERQLLSIALLAKSILALPDPTVRNALFCLLSGTLEFNNMFASYKGEGTGAVRHMFSHHILKPERTPLEANLWGTPKSSGAFSTLFRSRLLRAIEYRERPFEIKNGGKCFDLSDPMGTPVATSYADFVTSGKRAYISCGTSAKTDLPNGSVDIVVTDPPFFDNVHYSELADFFYAWQQHYAVNPFSTSHTTRHSLEVQNRDPQIFSQNLGSVFRECHRVLKDNGLLVFSYHHSRDEGWTSVGDAIWSAGFVFTSAFPVKAEMSGAAPKNATKEPIDLDIILICRKRGTFGELARSAEDAFDIAQSQIKRFWHSQRRLSRNDIKIILMGQALVSASSGADATSCRTNLESVTSAVERLSSELSSKQRDQLDA